MLRQRRRLERDDLEDERRRSAARRSAKVARKRAKLLLEDAGHRATENELRARAEERWPGFTGGLDTIMQQALDIQSREQEEEVRVGKLSTRGDPIPVEQKERARAWVRELVENDPEISAARAWAAFSRGSLEWDGAESTWTMQIFYPTRVEWREEQERDGGGQEEEDSAGNTDDGASPAGPQAGVVGSNNDAPPSPAARRAEEAGSPRFGSELPGGRHIELRGESGQMVATEGEDGFLVELSLVVDEDLANRLAGVVWEQLFGRVAA